MSKIAKNLTYNWWKYMLVLVSSALIWQVVFDTLAAPDKNEKIRITYIGENLACEEMEAELYRVLPALTEQDIESIALENPVNGQAYDFYSVLATRAYGADFIIFEESSLIEAVGQTYFKEIPTDKLEQYIDDVEYYFENGIPYGILIHNGTKENQYSEFYTGSEKCYLFITHTSVNFADVVEEGNVSDDAALRILEYLLEEP